MKKIKKIIVIISAFVFTSCSAEKNDIYVKNVFISKNNEVYSVTMEYYDFSREESNYKYETYSCNDIYKIGVRAMEDNKYNFRLCENVIITPVIFISDINRVVYFLNSLKIPVMANILCGNENISSDSYSADNLSENALRNISITDNNVCGIFPEVSSAGTVLSAITVNNGISADILSVQQYTVLNILINKLNECNYSFMDESYWASMEKIAVRFAVEGDTLKIKVNAVLKDFKGINNSLQGRRLLIKMLETDISNRIYELYENIYVNEIFNLYWYAQQKGVDAKNISVSVDIN